MNILVIGAGIFGSVISLVLSEDCKNNITLVERDEDILNRASKCNHNRLHFGFHYPRSIKTAEQSLDGMLSFFVNFKEAINCSFENYYLVEKNSKVDAAKFIDFCDQLNLAYKKQWPKLNINREKIELSLLTQEPIFDFDLIKSNIKTKLKNSKVKIILNKEIKLKKDIENFDIIINTTYANLNDINNIFNIKQVKMKLQDVVIPIIKQNMDPVGITIMDGPYCSLMPKGYSKNTFLLYHVTQSIIDEQIDTVFKNKNKSFYYENLKNSAKEYFSFLEDSVYLDCYRTIRALPINNDDERLSTTSIHEIENKKIINIISGKISTCWSTAYEIKKLLK